MHQQTNAAMTHNAPTLLIDKQGVRMGTLCIRCFAFEDNNNNNNNNNSEVLLGANIHRPDPPMASQEREESEN